MKVVGSLSPSLHYDSREQQRDSCSSTEERTKPLGSRRAAALLDANTFKTICMYVCACVYMYLQNQPHVGTEDK